MLLLHGTGSFRRAWDRVVPLLSAHVQTIVIDLPGFGRSPQLEPQPRVIADLVDALESWMDSEELSRPHMVGNSAGGWLALELAKRGRARSVTAFDPMGLWRTRNGRSPLYARWNFHLSIRAGRALRRWERPLFGSRIGRTLLMSQVIGRPWALTYEEARDAALNLIDSPGTMPMAEAVAAGRFTGGQLLGIPVTVAYGTRDHALLRRHRRADELPTHTRWVTLPRCGHLPMPDDPELVARVILEGSVFTTPSPEPISTESGTNSSLSTY
jgi:pimeloyl-ACP methyl ester carboxylesterase